MGSHGEGKFDLHQHYGALMGVPGAGGAIAGNPQLDCERRLAFMDAHGIAAAAIMPGHSYSAPRGLPDVVAINDGVHAYGALSPERFPALFGTVDPRHGRACLPEVDRLHSLGFKGVSWHHRMQGLPMDHPVMFDIVERMDALGLIAMCHCYAQGDFESPWRLRRLAERFPDTTFCALDAMTSFENLEQLAEVALTCGNVYIDLTSMLIGAQGIRWAIERVGAEKLVFGSNHYSMSPIHPVEALTAVDAAGCSTAETGAILGGNARSLLGL